MSEKARISVNLGCLPFVVSVLLFWAILAGLPWPGGTLHIDLLPPAIRLEKP